MSLFKVGTNCSYAPQEIIRARGGEVVRILAEGTSPSSAEQYLHPNLCGFARAFTGQILSLEQEGVRMKNGDSAIDCLVLVNSCDAMRRVADTLSAFSSLPVHVLDLPRNDDEEAVRFFSECLSRMDWWLAAVSASKAPELAPYPVTGVKKRLLEEIEEMNEKKALFARVQETLLESQTSGLAVEFFELAKGFLNGELDTGRAFRLIKKAEEGKKASGSLLLTGSIVVEPSIFHLLDSLGLAIAYADFCTLGRHTGRINTVTGEDPFLLLARGYLKQTPCARMSFSSERGKKLARIIETGKVDGLVYIALKGCDLFEYDFVEARELAKAAGIPVLRLESEFSPGSMEQWKTRLGAFAEMLS